MSRSEDLFAEAKTVIPGGVNSPVRAFNGVGGTPVYFKRAQGAYVYDEDDNHGATRRDRGRRTSGSISATSTN